MTLHLYDQVHAFLKLPPHGQETGGKSVYVWPQLAGDGYQCIRIVANSHIVYELECQQRRIDYDVSVGEPCKVFEQGH